MTVASVANHLGRAASEVNAYKDRSVEDIAQDLALSNSEALLIGALGTPLAVPGAPTAVTATVVSTTQVRVAFTPPANDGGAEINRYDVSAPGVALVSGTESPIIVNSDFEAATAFTFTVRAHNQIGEGAAGTAAPVTPNP